MTVTGTCSCASAGASTPPLRVFLFGGQSNMLGADAVISDATKIQDLVQVSKQTVADESSLLAQGGHFTRDWGQIRGHDSFYLGEPLYLGNPVKGHGPEVGFARAMGGNVAIVKFSQNFSALEGGRSPWVTGGSIWTAWQSTIDNALRALNRPYTVEGFGWIQGIDDGLLGRTQGAYQADLEQVIADLRTKFGDKPFVLGRSINSQIAGTVAMTPIRAAQVVVGGQANNAWVNTDDLTPYVNTHHMTAKNQVKFGRRLAVAWAGLAG